MKSRLIVSLGTAAAAALLAAAGASAHTRSVGSSWSGVRPHDVYAHVQRGDVYSRVAPKDVYLNLGSARDPFVRIT